MTSCVCTSARPSSVLKVTNFGRIWPCPLSCTRVIACSIWLFSPSLLHAEHPQRPNWHYVVRSAALALPVANSGHTS